MQSAADSAIWMDEIIPRDEGALADPVPEHARQVASEVRRIEDRARAHYDKGMALRQEIDSLDGTKQRGARNSRIDQYNYERGDVSNARKAAQALIGDYEKFRSRFPTQVNDAPPRFTLSELPEVFR